MRDILIGFVIAIVTILLFATFIFCIYKVSLKHDDKLWNGGHCDVCGSTWKYEQAVGHRSSTTFIYVCGNCGKRIEVDKVR